MENKIIFLTKFFVLENVDIFIKYIMLTCNEYIIIVVELVTKYLMNS